MAVITCCNDHHTLKDLNRGRFTTSRFLYTFKNPSRGFLNNVIHNIIFLPTPGWDAPGVDKMPGKRQQCRVKLGPCTLKSVVIMCTDLHKPILQLILHLHSMLFRYNHDMSFSSIYHDYFIQTLDAGNTTYKIACSIPYLLLH